MLLGDFHHHVNNDPIDGGFVPHSIGDLVDRAVAVGLHVLSITCHESIPYDADAARYAAQRGVLLLRGMEATVEGQHMLLINFREFPRGKCTVDEVRAAKTADALVIAPHPFYPAAFAAADALASHSDLFDAVEFSGMYTRLTAAFNHRAASFAQRARLPVVGNSDTHFLWQMGSTLTEIDADPQPESVIAAFRQGRVRLRTRPLSFRYLMRFIIDSHSTKFLMRDSLYYLAAIVRRTRRASAAPLLPALNNERPVHSD
jgi:predicted metal-dependent phosphoesterase TrpH